MEIKKIIEFMDFLKAKRITYSMYGSRTGSDTTADCSGAIYAALRNANSSQLSYVPSTETLHAYLIQNGFELHAENRDWVAKRGDIFIWGKKGASAGAGGHTGIFLDANNIIHCNYARNGVTVDDYNAVYFNSARMYVYVYRLKKNAQTSAQIVGKDNKIMTKSFTLATTLNLVSKPSTKGPLIATLRKGDVVKFDNIIIAENRLWACQNRANNSIGYIEIGTITAHGSVA